MAARLPHPRRGAALAHQVPARAGSADGPPRLPRGAGARAGPRATSAADLYVFSNLSMDTLDYTGPRVNEGSKGVLLGVGEPVRELPREFTATPARRGVAEVRVFCGGCLVVSGPSFAEDPDGGRSRLARTRRFAAGLLVVLVDDAPRRRCGSVPRFLWTTFTRFEPAADIHAAAIRGGAAPRGLHRSGGHRRPAEDRISPRALRRPCDLEEGLGPVAGVLPGGGAWRWATRTRPTSTPCDGSATFSLTHLARSVY